jgi:dienelactone hydrolase
MAAIACGGKKPAPASQPTLPDVAKPEPSKVDPVKREVWVGTLVLPTNLVDITVTFSERDGKVTASLDVPYAKLTGIALDDVAFTPDAIKFTWNKPTAPQAAEHYAFARTADVATGTLTTAGQKFYAKLAKLAPGEAVHSTLARPQTPKPPFPYAEREASIDAPEDGVLAGTLTIPAGKGPFPAVLLISGSGQQDRDETIFGHRSFRVIADRLTRDGFAVLRVDDRATGKTKGKLGSLDTDTTDALASFQWLAKQPEVDPKRVGLIGHSVGGVIAPAIAARTQKVAFIVALAGPGVSGADLVPLQSDAMMAVMKVPDDVRAKLVAIQRKVGAAIVKGEPVGLKAALRASLVDAAAATGQPKPDDATLDAAVEAKLSEVTNPWVVSFFKTLPPWRKVKCPVLAVTGDKDLQVPADANFAKISEAMRAGGNKDLTTMKRPGLNHLYQHATTGLVDEYAVIEETFDTETLDLVAKWLADKAHVK